MAAINDATLWQQEYLRQVGSIKASLHSLRLQADRQRETRGTSTSVKKMAHTFEMVDIAFQALNTPEPQISNPNGDLIPEPRNRWVGRREFLSDLKGDDR